MTEVSEENALREQLAIMYPDAVDQVYADLKNLIDSYADKKIEAVSGWSENDSFLITYGDSLLEEGQAPLQVLRKFLNDTIADDLSIVHILPFCPYTSDDGFSVVDYRKINPDLGDWDDVLAISKDYRMCYDAVVNHVSKSSVYMQGYQSGDPAYADFFIALDKDTDTSSVTRPRNLPLLHEYACHDGPRWLWTTFSEDQLDLNFENPKVFIEIMDVLLEYARQGASLVRLDAITYFWKILGTSCVHLPPTHAFVKLARLVYDAVYPHMIVLTETNVPHDENMSYFGNKGDEAQMIYNFTLSPMIIYSFMHGNAEKLSAWARTISKVSDQATFLNMTATHDGIGVRPTEGILTDAERSELGARVESHGGRVNYKANSDGSTSPYELNITYFDMINNPNADEDITLQVRRFMATQAIALSFIGIPAIYIHSLLGSRNDIAGMEALGINRRINRKQLQAAEIREELADASSRRSLVFTAYQRLLHIRKQQPAFHPNAEQEILDSPAGLFVLRRWLTDGQQIIAVISVSEDTQTIDLSAYGALSDVLDPDHNGDASSASSSVSMAAYQIRWLRSASTYSA